jgi:hypothetical protein
MPTVRVGGEGPFGRNLAAVRAIRARVRGRAMRRRSWPRAASTPSTSPRARSRAATATWSRPPASRWPTPDWWRKIELGRGADIRRCLFTNYCEGLDQKHVPVTCQLWDRDFALPDPDGAPPRRTPDGKRRYLPPAWPAGE